MRLPFEDWVHEQDFPEESDIAFREAVVAYKASAYRAALLFSFVGMGLCIRSRLLSARPPAGMDQPQWEDLIRRLQGEDTWDSQVFDCTQRQKAPMIFIVEDHLREEMKYWKNRRNDCAHFKRNEIAAPHVEAFWLFLRSNLGRWVPNGSAPDLLERITVHYDPNLTPKDADVTPLVRLIPQAVPELELYKFFEELVAVLTKKGLFRPSLNSAALVTIMSSILQVSPPPYALAAGAWLRSHPEHLLTVVRTHPAHVAVLAGHPQLVRTLWRKQLFKAGLQDLEVFCALLRNSLIPNEEREEAIKWLVDELDGVIPSDEQNRILTGAGFWSVFDREVFQNRGIRRFKWANGKAQLIASRLANLPLTEPIAQAICDTFSSDYHPFEARDALKEMLSANPAKMIELDTLANACGTSVPASLK